MFRPAAGTSLEDLLAMLAALSKRVSNIEKELAELKALAEAER